MKILNISAECYPAAKAGGLGDVLGALPKYLTKAGVETGVIIPKYQTKWITQQEFVTIYRGVFRFHDRYLPFAIEQEANNKLGFPFFVANIPGRFDRPGIYADPSGHFYGDEVERYLSFQLAVLEWIKQLPRRPEVLHCHDHHSGLIPFFVKYAYEYRELANIPTVFTIHNGQYHGAFSWEKMYLLPFFEARYRGLLDWGSAICPLASAIKCSWAFTTVSPNYLNELRSDSNGMEWLIGHEWAKAKGILNGIDTQTWNPATDQMLHSRFEGDISAYKAANKRAIQERFRIAPELPLMTFIGRLVTEKGADLLPGVIERFLRSGQRAAFVVLGTGVPYLMERFASMREYLVHFFDTSLEYNEQLAHQLYAGSDFLLMPSRVEPCGLNQMYAFRYGTIPIVRAVGGLWDTVIDMGEPDGSGRGIRFLQFSEEDMLHALRRAIALYYDKQSFQQLRHNIMQLDFSWEKSAQAYIDVYRQVGANV
jgi:starch synthase